MTDKSETTSAKTPILATVTLEDPIKRGEETIAFIQLRKPASGELRGLSMIDICKLEVNALHDLLPRITMPNITTDEVSKLDAADFFALSMEVANFFLPKGASADSPLQ